MNWFQLAWQSVAVFVVAFGLMYGLTYVARRIGLLIERRSQCKGKSTQ